MSHKTTGKAINCKWCQKPFHPRIDNVRAGRGVFCSNKCKARFMAEGQKKYKKCENCGVEFNPRWHKVRFCSRKCAMCKQHHPGWNSDRELVSTRKKMSQFCCGLIKRCLRSKTGKLSVELGYTPEQLRLHIESKWSKGMSWSNYGMFGDNVWNIDHKKPISTFAPIASVSEINALSNLRPMWAGENYSRPKK